MTNPNQQKTKMIAALLGALAVIAGAFGAHALKVHLPSDSLAVWNVAVFYQLVHLMAILALSGSTRTNYFWLAGIVLFSGSLYLLSTTTLHMLNINWLGPITPVGGLCFILGWLSFVRDLWLDKPKNGGTA